MVSRSELDDRRRGAMTVTASSGDRKMVFNLLKRRFFALVIAPVLFLSGMAYGDDRPLRT
jgi:hypothetical protein